MGALKLEVRCPQQVGGLNVDPDSNWSWNALIFEVNSLELKLKASCAAYTKTHTRKFPNAKKVSSRTSKGFVMRVSDDEMEDSGSDGEETRGRSLIKGKRFCFPETYLSDEDSSENDLALGEASKFLLDKTVFIERVLSIRESEHRQRIKEEVMNTICALESDMIKESARLSSALAQVDKNTEAKREMYRKLDAQFLRKIAEARDNHLIAVQRDHEHKSQIEERKIRNDAASEESKRREKALQEEKTRQDKARVQAEAAKERAEETRKSALEAERIAKEAAEKEAAETTNRVSGKVAENLALEHKTDGNVLKELNGRVSQFGKNSLSNTQLAGSMVKAADIALKLEAERLRKHKELDEKNMALRLTSNKSFRSYELQIKTGFRKINGITDIVRLRASEFTQIINNPDCPQSIIIAMFANKAVYQCEQKILDTYFAIAHVVVLVTSKFPFAMDVLLAEFHKACIYTVPKHFIYSKSALSEEAYYKRMGYKEDEGKLENTESYLACMASYMRLYGALVQTEINGVQNLHGLKEGWAWLARFLNALPANVYTATVLDAFLKMAGFTLFRKYKSQFLKILNVISRKYVVATEARRNPELNKVVMSIQLYIDERLFLQEPTGWRLETSLSSSQVAPQESQYYNQSNKWSNYS